MNHQIPPNLRIITFLLMIILLFISVINAQDYIHPFDRDTSSMAREIPPFYPYTNGTGYAYPDDNNQNYLVQLTPIFTVEPKDTFVVKHGSASLTCRAMYATDLVFVCNGETKRQRQHLISQTLDTESGQRILQTGLDVTRNDVVEFYGLNGYQCYCLATGHRSHDLTAAGIGGTDGQSNQVVSRHAQIKIATIKKYFEKQPVSTSVEINSTVELQCLPPQGVPKPVVYWTKDGIPLDVDMDPNLILSNEGSLLISMARLSDRGNYSCVAKNMANQRATEPASLNVYVNGGWSEWSSWPSCVNNCAKGYRKRYRSCNNPVPINNGHGCSGPAIQKEDCQYYCPVDGGWSEWSLWSSCNTDCTTYRRRSCINPSPMNGGKYCEGTDLETDTCSGDSCTNSLSMLGSRQIARNSIEGLPSVIETTSFGRQNLTRVALYTGLSVFCALLFLSFLLIFIFVRKNKRNGNRRRNLEYEATNTFSPYLNGAGLLLGLDGIKKLPFLRNNYHTSATNSTDTCSGVTNIHDKRYQAYEYDYVTKRETDSLESGIGSSSYPSHVTSYAPSCHASKDHVTGKAPVVYRNPGAVEHQYGGGDDDNVYGHHVYCCPTEVNTAAPIPRDCRRGDHVITAESRDSHVIAKTHLSPAVVGIDPSVRSCCVCSNNGGDKIVGRETDDSSLLLVLRPSPRHSPKPKPGLCCLTTADRDVANATFSLPSSSSPYATTNLLGEHPRSSFSRYPHTPPLQALVKPTNTSIVTTRNVNDSSTNTTAYVSLEIGSEGGRLTLENSGLFLLIPPGAISDGKREKIFLTVCRDDKDRPKLADGQTLLSPLILCGPPGLSLKKPAALTFEHCAINIQTDWTITVLQGTKNEPQNAVDWKPSLVVGRETIECPVYCHLEQDTQNGYLMVENLQGYALIGCSKNTNSPSIKNHQNQTLNNDQNSQADATESVCAQKLISLLTFVPSIPTCLESNLRIYCIENNCDGREAVILSEKKKNWKLINDPTTFSLSDNRKPLILTITNIAEGWKNKSNTFTQQIPYGHLWSGNHNALHCAFSLEQIDHSSVNQMSCDIRVQQEFLHCTSVHGTNQQTFNTEIIAISPNLSKVHHTCQNGIQGMNTIIDQLASSNTTHPIIHVSPTFRIPQCIKEQLCKCLDVPRVEGNDWRLLAKHLHFDRYIHYFAAKQSPTDAIITLWESQCPPSSPDCQSAVINRLTSILWCMKRQDAITILLHQDAGGDNCRAWV